MLSEFKLISTFVVEQMDAVTLRSVLFVNEFHHALERELSSGVFSFNNKKYIRKVLR